jgi:uncharacterized protein
MIKSKINFLVTGIDLAGSDKRNTGICTMKNKNIIFCKTVFTDEEIISHIKEFKPNLITIDAPLHLPPGRKTIEDNNGIHYRKCDLELRKLGIKFFPITLGPMRKLTVRGILLKKKFQSMGYKVVEVYPGATQDVLKIPRKQQGLLKLKKGLEKLGLKKLDNNMNGDELDAITAAYTGFLFLHNRTTLLGNFRTGAIIIPKNK